MKKEVEVKAKNKIGRMIYRLLGYKEVASRYKLSDVNAGIFSNRICIMAR